ncbi:MAG: hypothetical protein WCK16_04385 [Candidatus Moraniibacteriota bacterium]
MINSPVEMENFLSKNIATTNQNQDITNRLPADQAGGQSLVLADSEIATRKKSSNNSGDNLAWQDSQSIVYTKSGNLLQLANNNFSIKEGELIDSKLCTYDITRGIVCNTDFDISSWAKKSTKPNYTATEIGLGNVPNLTFSGLNTGDETNITIKNKLGSATATLDGYLTTADWNMFNSKQSAGSFLTTYNETDPNFNISQAKNITASHIAILGNTSNANSGDNAVNTLYEGLAGSKQDILTNPIIGTGTINHLSKFTTTGTLGNSLVFDNGTYVGIGTTNPYFKLSVSQTDALPGVVFNGTTKAIRFGWDATTSFIQGVDNTGVGSHQPLLITGSVLSLGVAGSERMRVDATGNIGIGTTSPLVKLQIGNGTISTSTYISSGSGNYDGTLRFLPANSTAWGMSMTYNDSSPLGLNFLRHSNSSAGVSAMFIERDTGKIGIGNLAPRTTLEVNNNSLAYNIEQFRIGCSDGTKYLSMATNNIQYVAGNSTSSFLSIGTNVGASPTGDGGAVKIFTGSNVLNTIFDRNGNVGIGTTVPTQKLTVAGNINVVGGSFIDDGTTLNVPDYVFETGYILRTIPELENYLVQNMHLPGVSSRDQIKKNGMNYGSMIMSLLEKTEENTLYTIENYKNIQENKTQITSITNNQNKIVEQLTGQLADQSLSVDSKLQLIGSSLDELTINQIKKIKEQILENKANISSVSADLKILQDQYVIIQDQYSTLSEILLVADGVYDFKQGILKATGISANAITAGAFSVKAIEDASTIGTSIICQSAMAIHDGSCEATTEEANGTSVIIKTTAVTANSRIFITPKVITTQPLSVTHIEIGQSFTVEVKNPVAENINFDWFIVEEK